MQADCGVYVKSTTTDNRLAKCSRICIIGSHRCEHSCNTIFLFTISSTLQYMYSHKITTGLPFLLLNKRFLISKMAVWFTEWKWHHEARTNTFRLQNVFRGMDPKFFVQHLYGFAQKLKTHYGLKDNTLQIAQSNNLWLST